MSPLSMGRNWGPASKNDARSRVYIYIYILTYVR